MSYANWLSSEFKSELELKKSAYHNDYAAIVDRLISQTHESDSKKVLTSFENRGYDAFTLDFVERLCTIIMFALHRETYTQIDRGVFKQKINKAIDGIDNISEALTDLDLDDKLTLLFSAMFPNVKAYFSANGDYWTFLDLLHCEKERLESIKNEEPLDPSPGADAVLSKRVYFVRRLYLDFIDHFGKPMTSSITRLAKIVLDDDVAETTVAGIIDRYKAKNSLTLQSVQVNHSEFFPRKVQLKETDSSETLRNHASAATRGAQIRKLAKEGHRASQIADELGIGVKRVRQLARQEGITLPDAAIGKVRSLNPNRIVNEIILTLEGCAFSIKLLENCTDRIDPDPERLDQMEEALTAIRWLQKTLKKVDQ